MDTKCLTALFIGIEDYDDKTLASLPNASRDAQDFHEALQQRGFQPNTWLLVGRVSRQNLFDSTAKFLECTEKNVTPSDGIHLVVVFVAAHGTQLESGELPAIWASDDRIGNQPIDLDSLLINPLDKLKGGRIKVWFVVDSCRENKDINIWTGNALDSTCRRLHWTSQTDFHFVFACDKGRVAFDQHSMTKALISALRNPENDLEAVCKEAQKTVVDRSERRQRVWIHSCADFSGIFRLGESRHSELSESRHSELSESRHSELSESRHSELSESQHSELSESRPSLLSIVGFLMQWTGSLLAVVVVLLWVLLDTNCRWYDHELNGQELAPTTVTTAFLLDFIVLFSSLRLDWIALDSERKSPLLQKAHLTILWFLCKVMTELHFSAVENLPARVTGTARFVAALGHNFLHLCFLCSAVVLVIRLLALQPELQTLGVSFKELIQQFLKGFFRAACPAVPLGMWRCYHFARMEEFFQQTAKLYVLCLYLGWLCSVLACYMSWRIRFPGRRNRKHQASVSNVSRMAAVICGVKTVWCFAPFVWPNSIFPSWIATQYHVYAFILERVCAVLTLNMYKLKDLAKLYNALDELP